MSYKLNTSRDVDTDEPGVFILNLPAGYRFNHDPMSTLHVYAYDSMKELRVDIKHSVITCECAECKSMLNRNK
jgi:hypothetical protein